MKIFVSFSGRLSRSIADKLTTWLKEVIPTVDLFVSSDIEKGETWFSSLLKELKQPTIGIICVTSENLHADWVLFEAGALAKQSGRKHVCVLLVDVGAKQLRPPLSQFQATVLGDKEDVLGLVEDINSWLPQPLESDWLKSQFNKCWSDLDIQVKEAIRTLRHRRNGIQISEDLLLHIIYRQLKVEQLENISYWLVKIMQENVESFESELSLIEGCLARMTGKGLAGSTLQQLRALGNRHCHKALLELMLLQFSGWGDWQIDSKIVESIPDSKPESRYLWALLALCQLRDGNDDQARNYFQKAELGKIIDGPFDHYLAIPFGALGFALGDGELGDRYFTLAKREMLHEGYPFVSLISKIDRVFVNNCLGQDSGGIPHVSELRGHALLLANIAKLIISRDRALDTLVLQSANWQQEQRLTKESLKDRLRMLVRKLNGNDVLTSTPGS